MQIRELSSSEMDEGYTLLCRLRLDLTLERFHTFLASQYPQNYRPIGAYEKEELRIYAGISIRENLEIGRCLIIDDFVVREGFEKLSREMVDFLGDYAKMHGCNAVMLFGQHLGLRIDDLRGFRPKRDGYIQLL